MKDILFDLGFDLDDLDEIISKLEEFGKYKVESFIGVLKNYGCTNFYIRDVIKKRLDIFILDKDRLVYTLEAIISNGDLIEEVLLDII